MSAALILIDGSSYLFRAYHALPPLTNSKGLNTGAAKGVVGMVRRLVADYPGDQVVVVFDAKGPTFRNEIYAEYKANRPPMPEELREQIEPIHAMIRAMGLPLVCVSGVEADDVIGTLALQAAARQQSVLISTGDKDMAQLVGDHVTLINTMTNTTMDHDGVVEKFGVPPELIIDLLALQGDKVDNIPGVAGVGEKTALALLQNLGGLNDIYADLSRVADLPVRGAQKLGARLAEHRESAQLSYRLATIKTDCALELSTDDLIAKAPDAAALTQWYKELEFKGWLSEALTDGEVDSPSEASPVEPPPPPLDVITVFEASQLDEWIQAIEAAPLFAFDTETTSLNYMQAEIVGVSVAVATDRAAYIPLAHDYPGAPEQLNRDTVLERLRPLLEDSQRLKVGQNLKYDANVLANYGITLRGIAHDSMLQSYVLDAVGSRHDMDTLALKYLGQKTTHFEEVAGKGAKQITFNAVAIEQAAPYAAEDAAVTLKLHETLWPKLESDACLSKLYRTIELPLVPILSRIERNGARVDRQRLADQSHELSERMATLEQSAHDLAGQSFNLGSPKQLGEILFQNLEQPGLKKTPRVRPLQQKKCLLS